MEMKVWVWLEIAKSCPRCPYLVLHEKIKYIMYQKHGSFLKV